MAYFPNADITGDLPSRWDAQPQDFEQITDSWEYEDGGKDFNEVASASAAPKRWEYEVELPATSHTEARAASQVYEDFWNVHRLVTPFYFTDKYGDTWDNVFIESYSRTHDAHKSWVIFVKFVLVGHGSAIVDPTPFSPLPNNWARTSTVTATRSYLESHPEQAVDGTRHTNSDWKPFLPSGGTGGWDSDVDPTIEPILTLDFEVERPVSHVRMYTLADAIQYSVEPTRDEIMTLFGNVSYEMDYWNGSTWVQFISVSGNDRVVRHHNFNTITTTKVRFRGQGTADHPTFPHARLPELETWDYNPDWTAIGPLEVLLKSVRENQWPNGLPTEAETTFTANGGPAAAFALGGDSDLLTFNVGHGLTLNGYVYTPLASPPESTSVRDGWIICILGHETVAAGINRVEYFVDRGFKTILLGMPNFEPNTTDWTYNLNGGGTVVITGAAQTHAQFTSVIEADGTPILPLFLDQVFRAANWIRDQEPDAIIHVTGHSGGGFMTSMAAVVDDDRYFTVKNSNAGELPFAYDSTPLHVEQAAVRPFFLGLDWPDLYPIGARYGHFTKSHNQEDPFFQAFQRHHLLRETAEDVNAAIAADYTGRFDIYVDPASLVHQYTDAMLQKFVDNLFPYESGMTPLDPTTIAWAAYIADAYTGLTDGDNVGNWNDSTANNRDATVIATPQWRADQIDGYSALEMSADSSDGFTLPDMSALTEVSSIEISRTIPTGAHGGSDFGTDAVNISHWPYFTTGDIYDAFGSDARKGPITPVSDLTEWGVHYCWSKTNDWGLMNDWVTAHTTATNTVGLPAAPLLWQNWFGGSQKGFLVARWIFPFKLSDEQRYRIRLWIEIEFPSLVTE